nr:hypothetical protein BaRGS_003047 [Batillaria attramentaria]
MVWGGISLNQFVGPVVFQDIGPGRGNGVTAQRYIDQVLRPVVVPHFQQHGHLTLQQDNARPHTARVTTDFQQHGHLTLQQDNARPHTARVTTDFQQHGHLTLQQDNARPHTARVTTDFQRHGHLTLQQDNARPHTARVTTDFQQHGHLTLQQDNARPHTARVTTDFQQHGHLTLQQDNARPHTARVTTDFLQQQGIGALQWPWPSLSPDLNPIEHFWDHLQRELNAAQPRPTTPRQPEQALRQIRNNVNMATVNRLIHSMPARCQAVINARGGHTGY